MVHTRSLLAATALLVALLAAASSSHAQDAYRVIVNVGNPVDTMTRSEAARLFLTRTTWDTGEPAQAVDLAPDSPVRQEFSRDVLGMSVAAALQHWKRNAGEAPLLVATDREVLAFVRLKRGAIGYVSGGARLQGVKVLTILKSK